ncbi:hypothetical protein C8R43DRAFT_1010132 [Mycena crocata]|nr:hypothetical protein C8R43DRAFT_1010132 [Mycena crocata]
MSQEELTAADELKTRGNAFFKSGKVAEASKCYAKAEKLCPSNPVYSSNLSAALFEEGDYLSCALTIDRCWKLHGSKANIDPGLALRLSGRFAKALSHGVRSRSVADRQINDMATTITDLRSLGLAEEPEVGRLWADWDNIAGETGDKENNVAEASRRFSLLPMFRKTPKPIREYFTIGQDALMSLVDDYNGDHISPLKIETMPLEELTPLSFLLGGVGDARHVYSTLVGLHRAYNKLDTTRQEAFRVHITLLDIHPAPLARDLCILLLLEQLMETPSENSVARAEIISTMFYTFAGVVMPEYCYDRLEKVMHKLRLSLKGDGPSLPSWIYVPSTVVDEMCSILEFWSSIPQKHTTEEILRAHDPQSPAGVLELVRLPNISAEYRAVAQARIDASREEVMDMIKGMSGAQLRSMGLAPPSQNASSAEKKRFARRQEEVINSMLEDVMNNNGNMNFERYWYEKVKVFVPPRELWSRHVGMELFPGMSQGSPPSMAAFSKISEHINETWKPNSTLFDPARVLGNTQVLGGIPDLKLDPFEAPGYIDLFNQRFGISSTTDDDTPDAPSVGNFADLFERAAEALNVLKGQVKLEFICGELTQELLKIRVGGDHARPAEFPRKFKRGHLSNIPDYTHGTLNTIVYALPVIEEVASNCYLNTGIWASDEEFIHTYTLLKPADVPKYLGCQFISQEATGGLVILRKQVLPLPLIQLPTRSELVTWLTRVLLYTILPSSSHEGRFRARLPNNLVAFVALLIHLRHVGYPAHWLSEFLQAVLSGTLLTDIAPYTDKWPIPASDTARRVPTRVVRLDPWTAELESILATALHGIPFCVPRPEGFAASYSEIGTFEATVKASSHWMGYMMGTMVNPMPVEDPVSGLLFYKSSAGLPPDELVGLLPAVLNGAKSPAPGTLCVLTSQEKVSVPIIRWRLSKARVARMKEEGWVMVAYRTDVKLSFTAPVSANQWREI